MLSFKKSGISLLLSLSLMGCHALYTVSAKQDIHVQTKFTRTIFLKPSDRKKIIYIQVKNTSQYPSSLKKDLVEDLEAKGYQVTTTLKKAQYLIQANIRNVNLMNRNQINNYYKQGFLAEDIATGAIAGSLISSPQHAARGALIGGAVGFFANVMFQDNYVGMIVDVQFSERLKKPIKTNTVSKIKQGQYTTITSRHHTQSYWQSYQTRFVSAANRVNLTVMQALPVLSHHAAVSIASIVTG